MLLICTSVTPISTPEELPVSSPEPSLSSLDTSSSQPRFACHYPQCGSTFNRRADRDRHARVHDGVREYVCPKTNCLKEFYRKDKLQGHLENGH
ncbi:uncharacterized protein BDR25DRAFT_102196 [Lindgomyces ingoldianus]|uniref:Uncharacterized protein n=1 Tax=Lindgomyces ingoldianus TaxID=673940 RepID=A0ACB6R892_9PLEO|nr:uncharacterized protein BDR25DRAFT_102196 [Lindgomyces ingoldianus]KAF2475376.1 hypothetical protein BDR25DRAFT_102196 [Lindgomyces ingoldianus]